MNLHTKQIPGFCAGDFKKFINRKSTPQRPFLSFPKWKGWISDCPRHCWWSPVWNQGCDCRGYDRREEESRQVYVCDPLWIKWTAKGYCPKSATGRFFRVYQMEQGAKCQTETWIATSYGGSKRCDIVEKFKFVQDVYKMKLLSWTPSKPWFYWVFW